MRLEYQILLAVALDLLIGDPKWFPHPVKLMGRAAMRLEDPLRRACSSPRLAGVCVWLVIVGLTAVITLLAIVLAGHYSPMAGDLLSIFIIYTGVACRDLWRHSGNVLEALQDGDLAEARIRVGFICGRDTGSLDESGVTKATIESAAENLVDGVTAPLLFACLAGPVGIMVYKAISTLDSTFGYKNEQYKEFGWLSARADDAVAWIPARVTAFIVPVAAALLGLRTLSSLKVLLRDRRKHPSPNAGWPEAAFAGALGIQLGGLSHYEGRPVEKPRLGDLVAQPDRSMIRQAMNLMLISSALTLALYLGVRLFVEYGLG